MNISSHIRHDVSLRNLTVYAQWLSFLAIVACWIRGAWWLVHPIRFYGRSYHVQPIYLAISILNVFLFPVAPLFAIMPYLSKYSRCFFWIGILWWHVVPFACVITSSRVFRWGLKTADWALTFDVLLILAVLLFFLTTPKWSTPETVLRLSFFHLGYTIWISFWVGTIHALQLSPYFVIRPHFEWPMTLAAMATVLYFVAWRKRHDIVLSRTLGGPGIEPMSLTLPSSEPEYYAITNEGRIQLT